MESFSNIKEILRTLYDGRELLTELFKNRKTIGFKYEYALNLLDQNRNKIELLLDRAVLRRNGDNLEIDDLYLRFFEEILEANEEINISYINENLDQIRQNITYFFNETNEQRRYDYLRVIKTILRRIGLIALRNVVDLKRNVDNTFKSEPNFKNKKAKLIYLDKKRKDIVLLIEQADHLITEDDKTFFKTAMDEELDRIVIQLRLLLQKSTHNLIEIERQIIDFLNQIQLQSTMVERLRQIKYLKDQFILESTTNIKEALSNINPVAFEPNPAYPLKLSLAYLQENDEAFEIIRKIAKQQKVGSKIKRPVADNISKEYLETKIEEEVQINLEEVKNGFLAGSNNLFDFVMSYNFSKSVSFEERVTIFCQLVSQYDELFRLTNQFKIEKDVEFLMIYPK